MKFLINLKNKKLKNNNLENYKEYKKNTKQ